jgi:hypothetical protein
MCAVKLMWRADQTVMSKHASGKRDVTAEPGVAVLGFAE